MGDITITGNVTGNVQSGSHAQATYIHSETTAPATTPAESPEVGQLLAAVEALREQLRATIPADLHADDARLAEEALDEVAAAGLTGALEPGRLRRAVATLTGTLVSAAGLAQAVAALREAAGQWL